MDKIKIALILIVSLGTLIRFWSLGDNNIGLFRDEAALGFNSWSILQTGRDEYGQKLPVFFRSFEVFFMPAYVYLSVPIMKIFGLNEFSTRLLSALSGIFLILFAFLIGRKIFKSERVGIFSAIIVAFSPWSIFYSKGAFEGNLALLFFATGFYFWIKFLDKFTRKYFFISLLFFLLSMYSYQSPRLVVPIFLGVSIISLKNVWELKKVWILGLLLALFLYLPILLLSFQPASYHRALGVSVFSRSESSSIYSVFNQFASMYLHYYSPMNLFWLGDYNNQRSVEGFSTFYFWIFPFLMIGVWKFIKGNFQKKPLLIWTLLGPLPASLTPDPFHTYRAILFFMPISLMIAFGISNLLDYFKRFKLGFLFALIMFFTFSLIYYLFNFLLVSPLYKWRDWDFGYKEIAQLLKKEPKDIRVVIDDPNTESYIHLLFYGVIPISDYQNEAKKLINGKYYSDAEKIRPQKIGRFEFRKVDWPSERGESKTIFIFPSNRLFPSEFSGDPKLNLEKIILTFSGEAVFYIVRVI